MYYEINVSHKGKHFFATDERSIRDLDKAEKVYHEMVKRFPASDGYTVTVTEYRTTGNKIDM